MRFDKNGYPKNGVHGSKDYVVTPSMKARATMILKIPKGETEDSIQGYDRFGYYFDIAREANNEFYILVLHPSGLALYDGYLEHSWGLEKATLRSAVIDAVFGSKLITHKKKQKKHPLKK